MFNNMDDIDKAFDEVLNYREKTTVEKNLEKKQKEKEEEKKRVEEKKKKANKKRQDELDKKRKRKKKNKKPSLTVEIDPYDDMILDEYDDYEY